MKSHSKIIVLEVNEVPPFLLNAYIEKNPQSSIAKLYENSARFITIADDADPNHLYPAQTWASINSGIPYQRHQIFRYNDPKDKAPQIWDILAKKYKVGVINSIHSSAYHNKDKMQYFIPDPYTKSTQTKPAYLKHFQLFKIRQTFSSGRVARYRISAKDCLDTLFFLRFISLKTIRETLKTILNAIKGQYKERLRNIEFLLHADIFYRLLKKKDSQINVLFTNHIASQMHRYLGAQFPNDFIQTHYGEHWINQYQNECIYALNLLDDFIKTLINEYPLEQNRYVICSGMGQFPIHAPQSQQLHGIFIQQPEKFWAQILPTQFSYQILGAMVPQLTIALANKNMAIHAEQYIKSLQLGGFSLYTERKADILTVSFRATHNQFTINKKQYTANELGATININDKANTGRHMPRGVLWIGGKNIQAQDYGRTSYLNYVNLIRQSLNFKQDLKNL